MRFLSVKNLKGGDYSVQYKYRLRPYFKKFEKLDYLMEENDLSASDILVDCSFGVNPFGYSPRIDPSTVLKGVDMRDYGPYPFNAMRDQLIAHWSEVAPLARENFRVCSGSMRILDALTTVFVEEGVKVLGYSPQFPEFTNSVALRGGTYEGVPLRREDNYAFDPEAMVSKLKSGEYPLAYIDNPNNPTGQVIPLKDIESVLKEAAKYDTAVIVDEAYGDFMSKAESAIKLIPQYDNLMVVRSFSKGYALAGMRLGYIAASKELIRTYALIDDLLVSVAALAVGKIAMEDDEHLQSTIEKTKEVKGAILSHVKKFIVPKTDMRVPIFSLVLPSEKGNLLSLLRKHGIVGTSGFPGMGHYLARIRIPDSPDLLIKLLGEVESEL